MADRARRWRPFAGGTDLMVLFDAGTLPEGHYVGLWKLTELRGIHDLGGAFAHWRADDVHGHPRTTRVLARSFPLLGRAAAETGGVATQNRGTIGGNIANASPAADTPPALLVYDAELELQSRPWHAARALRSISPRLQGHGSRAGRAHHAHPSASHARAGGVPLLPQGRARDARRRSRRSASPRGLISIRRRGRFAIFASR